MLGRAITRAVDLARERNLEEVLAQAGRRRDLDETRRLAYAVRNSRQSRAATISATLVNALADRGLAADPNVACSARDRCLQRSRACSDSERWLQQQIDQIK